MLHIESLSGGVAGTVLEGPAIGVGGRSGSGSGSGAMICHDLILVVVAGGTVEQFHTGRAGGVVGNAGGGRRPVGSIELTSVADTVTTSITAAADDSVIIVGLGVVILGLPLGLEVVEIELGEQLAIVMNVARESRKRK